MATTLLSRIAFQQSTGDDGRGRHPGQRAEQAMVLDVLGQDAKAGNAAQASQIAALARRGEARAGEGMAPRNGALKNRGPMRAGAAAVTEITAAASCIRASSLEGA